jgi:hypothetical protein
LTSFLKIFLASRTPEWNAPWTVPTIRQDETTSSQART